jgi:2-polyprenyl-6-methoxyphenol hydroxylase-like FAD-dependent oxidoreductase
VTLFVEPPWHRGRIVLAGDAAHTLPPAGSAGPVLGLEDAAVLDEELAAADDVAPALVGYEHRRVPRCRAVAGAAAALAAGEAPAAAVEDLLTEPF